MNLNLLGDFILIAFQAGLNPTSRYHLERINATLCPSIEPTFNRSTTHSKNPRQVGDRLFDCITMNDVLEHLVEPTEVLKLLKSKLSENGVLVASIPNVRYISNLRRLLIQKDWKYCEVGILDSTHLRFFTQKSMKRMFEEAGYEVLYQKGLNKDKSFKTTLFNLLTCYYFNDVRFVRFANVAK